MAIPLAEKPAGVAESTYLIWRNLPTYPSTFGECSEGCGRGMGRGCGPCLECARESLGRACGDQELANRYVAAARTCRELERAIYDRA